MEEKTYESPSQKAINFDFMSQADKSSELVFFDEEPCNLQVVLHYESYGWIDNEYL